MINKDQKSVSFRQLFVRLIKDLQIFRTMVKHTLSYTPFLLLLGLLCLWMPSSNADEAPDKTATDWTHAYANARASSALYLPETDSPVDSFFDIKKIDTLYPVLQMISIDWEQDGSSSLICANEGQTCIFQTDPFSGNHTILFEVTEGKVELVESHIAEDSTDSFVLIRHRNPKSTSHYLLRKEKQPDLILQTDTASSVLTTLQIANTNALLVLEETETTSLLRLYIQNEDEAYIPTAAYSPGDGFEWTGNFAITETPFDDYFALLQFKSSDTEQYTLFGYLVFPDSIEPLWELPLQPGIHFSRVLISQNADGSLLGTAGTVSMDEKSASGENRIVQFDLETGTLLHSLPTMQASCRDLAAINLDDDPEEEIIYLDSDDNLHRVDFDQMTVRTVTNRFADHVVGLADMISDPRAEIVLIQQIPSVMLIYVFNQFLDPALSPTFLRLSGSTIAGRAILADANANGYGEVYFRTQENPSQIYAVMFLDPTYSTPPSSLETWHLH